MANPTKYGVTADMAWTTVGSDAGIKEGKAVFQMHHLAEFVLSEAVVAHSRIAGASTALTLAHVRRSAIRD